MQHRQLEYVVAVVEEGSFTQAAISCDVAQPSLSAAIARLERDLGIALFHRIGRRVVPTDACLEMLPSARDVIRSTRAVRDAVRDVRSGVRGHLDIAAQPTVIGRVVELVADFRDRHPGVTVALRSPADDSVATLVRTGQVDLGIGDAGSGSAGLTWQPLWTETYVCVDAVDAAADEGPCRVEDLVGSAVVAPPVGSATRSVLDEWFARAGSAPAVAIEVDHREAIVPLVARGCGAALLPASVLVGADLDGVRVRPLEPPVGRDIGVLHRGDASTPTAQRFLEVVLSGT